jgi:hypothetical protein
MKEAPGSSETSVLTRATRRNNPEDTILHGWNMFVAHFWPQDGDNALPFRNMGTIVQNYTASQSRRPQYKTFKEVKASDITVICIPRKCRPICIQSGYLTVEWVMEDTLLFSVTQWGTIRGKTASRSNSSELHIIRKLVASPDVSERVWKRKSGEENVCWSNGWRDFVCSCGDDVAVIAITMPCPDLAHGAGWQVPHCHAVSGQTTHYTRLTKMLKKSKAIPVTGRGGHRCFLWGTNIIYI